MTSEGLNKVILIGHVDGEPRFRAHPAGRHRLWLRLRTCERRRDGAGGYRERLGWHTVVVWGNRAEALAAILRPGHRVAVEGRLVTRKVVSVSPPRYDTEVHARELVLLDRAGPGRAGPGRAGPGRAGPARAADVRPEDLAHTDPTGAAA